MAVTIKFYGQAPSKAFTGAFNLPSDTLKLSLHTSSYTPNLDTHDYANDLTSEIANGGGYTTGGATLSGVTVTYDAASDQTRIDFNDVTWTLTAAKTFRYGVVYKARGGASSADELLALIDFGADITQATPFTLVVPPEGALYVDAS